MGVGGGMHNGVPAVWKGHLFLFVKGGEKTLRLILGYSKIVNPMIYTSLGCFYLLFAHSNFGHFDTF